MRPSEWKFGLPLSTKVKSDMYRPLGEEGGRRRREGGVVRDGWRKGGREQGEGGRRRGLKKGDRERDREEGVSRQNSTQLFKGLYATKTQSHALTAAYRSSSVTRPLSSDASELKNLKTVDNCTTPPFSVLARFPACTELTTHESTARKTRVYLHFISLLSRHSSSPENFPADVTPRGKPTVLYRVSAHAHCTTHKSGWISTSGDETRGCANPSGNPPTNVFRNKMASLSDLCLADHLSGVPPEALDRHL